MTNSVDILTTCLFIATAILCVMVIILIFVYARMKVREKQLEEKPEEIKTENKEANKSKVKQYTVESVFDFMEFDKIEDNMIIQKNGTKFIMVIECQGVNYDLMSEEEKIGVEEGFNQFLNTLTGPIQIYTQTRKINLESSIRNYKERVNAIDMEYAKQKMKYDQLSRNTRITSEELKKEYIELIKLKNLSEYGRDIVSNTEKMSLSRNILTQKYYVAIASYALELGQSNLDKSEMKELAFSDLYTKAQAIIRALAVTGVMGKVMSSVELADLLYVAYNREDSDIFDVDKAIKSRYDEMYSTAPDYMQKKIDMLNKEIDKQAYEMANRNVIKAQTELEKEYNKKSESMDDIIANIAKLIIEQNQIDLGKQVADKAIENVDEEKERKEKNKNVQEENKKARRTTSAKK